MELEIHIDRNRCIGAGQCFHLAPGVFDLDADAKAVVVDGRGEPEDKIVHAVTACPMQAITLAVDGAAVGDEELRGWMHGTRSANPIVSLLMRFSEEHHELRATLTATDPADPAARAEAMRSATSTHLHDEDDVYAAITELIDPRLVEVFDADHVRIHQALDELAASASTPSARERAMHHLATAVDEHIRLEEAVLFPVALAALARQASAAMS